MQDEIKKQTDARDEIERQMFFDILGTVNLTLRNKRQRQLDKWKRDGRPIKLTEEKK